MKAVLNTKDKSKVRNTKTALAKKLGVSRGMLYYTHRMKVTDEVLKTNIEVVMDQNQSYGHKRIALELKLNKKRILRIMKKYHLMPKRRRGKKPTKPKDQNRPQVPHPNLIESFCPIKSNVVWVGDFTHIRFQNSWVYLSTVMDIYSREIIGWHLATNHQRDLVIEAFVDAVEKRKLTPVYFHSDQGSEYDSDEYLKLMNGYISLHDYTASATHSPPPKGGDLCRYAGV